MDEDGAAAVTDTRARVVIDFNNEVVETVRAPETVTRRAFQQADRLIVAAVVRVFAPAVIRPNGPHGQSGARPRRAVGSPPKPDQPETPARRRAVALEFVGENAATAEGYRNDAPTEAQDALRPNARLRRNINGRGALQSPLSLRISDRNCCTHL